MENFNDQTEEELTNEEETNVVDDQSIVPEQKEPHKFLLIAIFVLLAVFLLLALSYVFIKPQQTAEPYTEPIKTTIQLDNPIEADNIDDKEIHYLGILPLENPSAMLERFSAVEKYLRAETNLNIKR